MGLFCTISKALAIGAMGLAIGLVDRSSRPIRIGLDAPQPVPAPAAATPIASAVSAEPERGTTTSPTPAPPAPAPQVASTHSGQVMITLDEAKAIFDSGEAEWIDARTLEEYNVDRIGAAFHIAPDAFFGGKIPDVLSVLDRDKKLVVYCGGGDCDASLLVALNLKDLGFKNIVVMKDGWKGWTAAKYPTAIYPGGGW